LAGTATRRITAIAATTQDAHERCANLR